VKEERKNWIAKEKFCLSVVSGYQTCQLSFKMCL